MTLRIADCGLRTDQSSESTINPHSAIRNPQF